MLAGHAGLAQTADGEFIISVALLKNALDDFLLIGLAFFLVVAAFEGKRAGGTTLDAGGAAILCLAVFGVFGIIALGGR